MKNAETLNVFQFYWLSECEKFQSCNYYLKILRFPSPNVKNVPSRERSVTTIFGLLNFNHMKRCFCDDVPDAALIFLLKDILCGIYGKKWIKRLHIFFFFFNKNNCSDKFNLFVKLCCAAIVKNQPFEHEHEKMTSQVYDYGQIWRPWNGTIWSWCFLLTMAWSWHDQRMIIVELKDIFFQVNFQTWNYFRLS